MHNSYRITGLEQEDHKRAKVTAAFVNNVSKLGKPKLNRIFVRLSRRLQESCAIAKMTARCALYK